MHHIEAKLKERFTQKKKVENNLGCSLRDTNNNTMKNLKSRNEMKKDKTYSSMKKTKLLPPTSQNEPQNLKQQNLRKPQ
jgi:hypothetical protein